MYQYFFVTISCGVFNIAILSSSKLKNGVFLCTLKDKEDEEDNSDYHGQNATARRRRLCCFHPSHTLNPSTLPHSELRDLPHQLLVVCSQ